MTAFRLETPRLCLRDFSDDASEVDAILRFAGDPEVVRLTSWGPLNPEEAKAWWADVKGFQTRDPRLSYQLFIEAKAGQEIIGNIGLHIRDEKLATAEIGYNLVRSAWGQGYASEAAAALLRFAFHDLKLHRVYATTAPDNVASQAILRKLRFREEGYLRKNVRSRGAWRDSCLFAILDEDYV